ncbi:unnamed protein product [Rotaria sp. Silwood1]|nr:unnamed protein product [Rotaria sp. Silwood1]CAF0961493.1 unnamed protein product [Rotaria sp. Silwood1]CAF4508526.1 unnamed protein product [Rotaria sp. Silwood1]
MPEGTLEVIVVEGRELKDRDIVGQNDAYIEIYTEKNLHSLNIVILADSNAKHDDLRHFTIKSKGDQHLA